MTTDTYHRTDHDADDGYDEPGAYATNPGGPNAADRALDAVGDLASAAWAMYRQHLRPVALLAVCAAAGAIVCDGRVMFILVLPAVAVAVAVAYARSKHRGHRAAQERGHLEAGQLNGRHADRINAEALRVATITAICGAWVLAANITNPATLAGWIVWVVFGLIPWAVFTTPSRTRAEQRRLRVPAGGRRARRTVPTEDDDAETTVRLPAAGTPPQRSNGSKRPSSGSKQPVSEADNNEGPSGYQLPDLPAGPAPVRPAPAVVEASLAAGDRVVQDVLDRCGIAATVTDHMRGPTVTRYEIKLNAGSRVRVQQVEKLADDFQYALATESIRIEAPVRGKTAIGVEAPNPQGERDLVTLDQLMAVCPADAHPLTLPIGAGSADGVPELMNLAEDGPHLFVAGASGAGKSGWVNAALCFVLSRATPEQVRMLLIDPKQVELARYAGIPHLVGPIVTDVVRKADDALAWAENEMEARYADFAAVGVVNIDEYNEKVAAGEVTAPRGSGRIIEPHPYLLILVDELADLVMLVPEIEERLIRIGQKGRAAGLHMVLATQSPRADVITPKIKTNVSARLGFQVSDGKDSSIILDERGAERLMGRGDCLWKPKDAPRGRRLQAPWVPPARVKAITQHWRDQASLVPARDRTVAVNWKVAATDPVDDTNPNSTTDVRTAPEIVLDAARRLAESYPDGFDKAQIAAETPQLMNATRDRALTDLTRGDASPLTRVTGERGRYTLRTTTE